MPTALVRRPGPRLAEGIVTHQERTPVDVALASRQWQAYVDAMSGHGWDIVEAEPADDHPDAVFIEDALVVFDDLAVVTRPGAPERRGEISGAERAALALGLDVRRLEPVGTLDGGDVLKVGRDVYVGVSARTDAAAVARLADLLRPRGWSVRPVPTTRVLHLKSAVTALPDGTIVGYPDAVDDAAAFDRFLAVPEPAGAHVVLLGDGTDGRPRVLMSADAPASAAMFRDVGLAPVEVDISEFEKLEGCVTCLSVRVRT